ncbi:MAG: hypothetical protein V3T78_05310 [Dehalococcoidia bacterium]
MERMLLTKRGRAHNKKRGVPVEPVWPNTKGIGSSGKGRGLTAAYSEGAFIGTTHNLL